MLMKNLATPCAMMIFATRNPATREIDSQNEWPETIFNRM